MADLIPALERAVASGALLESSRENIVQLLERATSTVYQESVDELIAAGAWDELNDRFYKTLAFGTGGLRGRTIGKIVTRAELGTPARNERPQRPCVGTNAMNYYNISRATQGLVGYLKDWFETTRRSGRPKIAIAHDTRHFSPEFAELAAQVAMENGCDVALFGGPRSTPELSFAVRHTMAHAGIVLTASHNPPHDNGYKVYFDDGAQVVEPHASGIIAKVNAIASDVYEPVEKAGQGKLEVLGEAIDVAYMERLQTLVLDRPLIEKQKDLSIVFTSIHGTGGAIIRPMFKALGLGFLTVPEQEIPDGRFPTVKSPNPENAEALSMAIALAEKENADLVIATDPDCDRMGVAARNASGEMRLFSGNQIGSLLAYYRVRTLVRLGVITKENASRAVLIKTLVTTDLQKAIAEKDGLRCVETLTGFKYIGEKLGKYEAALPEAVRSTYRGLSEGHTRDLRLHNSSYYVFGGEESYGYSGADFIRDKDGNGSAVMFAEVAAYAKSRQLTLDGLLDEIYSEYGFYLEKNASLTFEGAEGAAKIKRLVESYAASAPVQADGAAVLGVRNFAKETFIDIEGDKLPAENMIMFDLTDGRRVAVRPSGTEPKIKYYLFAHRKPPPDAPFAKDDLLTVKEAIAGALDRLWIWLQEDAQQRLAA